MLGKKFNYFNIQNNLSLGMIFQKSNTLAMLAKVKLDFNRLL